MARLSRKRLAVPLASARESGITCFWATPISGRFLSRNLQGVFSPRARQALRVTVEGRAAFGLKPCRDTADDESFSFDPSARPFPTMSYLSKSRRYGVANGDTLIFRTALFEFNMGHSAERFNALQSGTLDLNLRETLLTVTTP